MSFKTFTRGDLCLFKKHDSVESNELSINVCVTLRFKLNITIIFFNSNFSIIGISDTIVSKTIEIKFDDSMSCLLARGHIDERSLEITIPEQTLTTLTVPSYVDNMSFESLIINKDRIIALFEANGDSLVEKPHALSINLSGNDIEKNTISSINYRIADATKTDGKNQFWAINYFFPGDKKYLGPKTCILGHEKNGSW